MWIATHGGLGEERRGRVGGDASRMIWKEGGLRAVFFALLTIAIFGDGTAAFDVLLRAPNYVFVGDSALLKCEHGVSTALLHKVEWLKDGDHKLFQFVRGRNPPFRNFTTPGATLDWSRSNEHEIHLTGLSLEASGIYSCEVSMETPIYTKPSNDERLVVIQRQSEDPVVRGVKTSYYAGEKIAVNCTSSPSHPPVQISWLVNEREVSDQLLTRFSDGSARQYELTTHGAHHIRPFRTSSDDNLDDLDSAYGSRESPGSNALGTGTKGRKTPEKGKGGKTDFLASAALGKLTGAHVGGVAGTTATAAGSPTAAAPTRAAAYVPGGATMTATRASGGAGSPGVEDDDDEGDSAPLDAFDPPEVVPVVTATASSSTVQLSFVLTEEVVRYLKKDSEDTETQDGDPTGPKIRLILTCSAIIPEFSDSYGRYADQRSTTIGADVILSEETTARFSSATPSSSVPPRPWMLFLPLLSSLLLLAANSPALPQAKRTSWFLFAPHSAALPYLSVLPSTVYSLNHVRPRR